MTASLSCGVLVTDGVHLLIGHATRSPRWDIPKGGADPGEAPEDAARRELQEETGLLAPCGMRALGRFPYRPGKDLALFVWTVAAMPDPRTLVCRSTFSVRGALLPEFDRFDCPPWAEALPRLGKALGALLTEVMPVEGWPALPSCRCGPLS